MRKPRILLDAFRRDGFRRKGLYFRVDVSQSSSGNVWIVTQTVEGKYDDSFVVDGFEVKYLSEEEAEVWRSALAKEKKAG